MKAMKVFGMAMAMGLVVGTSCVGEEAANVEQLQTFYCQQQEGVQVQQAK